MANKKINETSNQQKVAPEKVEMQKHISRFLTVSIILFLIVVFLFGLYMLYFGK